jgi:hypothetical protein
MLIRGDWLLQLCIWVSQAEADLWNADPFDPEAQARIAERIQQEHIAHNYEQAYENNPEVAAV